jgi:hypothetical protein
MEYDRRLDDGLAASCLGRARLHPFEKTATRVLRAGAGLRRPVKGGKALTSTWRGRMICIANLAPRESYIGNGQLAPAGLTNASFLARPSRT